MLIFLHENQDFLKGQALVELYAKGTLIDEKNKEKDKEKEKEQEREAEDIDEEEKDEMSYSLDEALHRIELLHQAVIGTEEVLEQGSFA